MRRRLSHTDLDLSPIWQELELPGDFPAEVAAAAESDGDSHAASRRDATDIALVTVDPPGAMDLDQALHLTERDGGGWRVHYAIADLGALVPPDGPVDVEARLRGETLYLPDGRVPLHPPALSEGTASLLPRELRPAVLWTIDLDTDGEQVGCTVERAMVRSRERYTYAELQDLLDAGTAPAAAAPLAQIGPARMARARREGAIELGLPGQEVTQRADGTWTIEHRVSLPVENWNAQISMLTGMAAAGLMVEAGLGLLRTLPDPEPRTVEKLRRAAPGLDVDWPKGAHPGAVLATCDPRNPRHAAFLDLAAELLRGAGYTPFDGAVPEAPGHAGVGATYAHVTAPIRRLADRFATEVCLAVSAGEPVPDWARTALPQLPELMAESGRRARTVDRMAIDHVEAWLLTDRVGESFDVAVVEVEDDRKRSTVVLEDPAVRALCDGRLPLGDRVTVTLTEADVATRQVRFSA